MDRGLIFEWTEDVTPEQKENRPEWAVDEIEINLQGGNNISW